MNSMKAKLGMVWKIACILYVAAIALLMVSFPMGWNWLAFKGTALQVLGVMAVGWSFILIRNRLKKSRNPSSKNTQ